MDASTITSIKLSTRIGIFDSGVGKNHQTRFSVDFPRPNFINATNKKKKFLDFNIDQLLIHQQIELLEALTGFETCNKYEIKNSLGQRIYFAAEDTDCCTRNCCGPSRPFTMRILDNMGREVITLERPLRCTSCCFPCCLQEIEIQAPPGVPVGYVTQTWHPCLPKFTLQNERREDVLRLTGPCIVCSCCADVDFEIKSLDDKYVVGKISKQWTGLVRELFTDVDNFGIQFPLDLDVKMKAVMLGACFLIVSLFLLIWGIDGFSRIILK
ncbi:hypothetical protein EI555_013562 [Monodon monoceros]|uniref:Phospholipid scramblase n=1 Tax=Monodon monoceros TaxID=40151 RepID=A0A4U1EIH5_MONMO|nr:hypothetical protein EI555_013562 [Monodon monoceros]